MVYSYSVTYAALATRAGAIAQFVADVVVPARVVIFLSRAQRQLRRTSMSSCGEAMTATSMEQLRSSRPSSVSCATTALWSWRPQDPA
jgi:hypothetical protein